MPVRKLLNLLSKNKSKVILLLLGALIAYLIISRLIAKRPDPAIRSSSIKPKINQTDTYTVVSETLTDTLIMAGKIFADKIINVQFQAGGKLAWVGVKEGDRLKKGQAIASLDRQTLQKQFEKTANDYLTSRWNFEDTQDEYKQTKSNSLVTDEIQRILDRQQFNLNKSVLDYEIANLAVKYATIYSPFEGILVVANPKFAGVNVTAANSGYTIVDPGSIYFRAEIDEEDVNRLQLNQKAIVRIDSYPDDNINTEIKYIAFTPVEGQTSTVYEIKFSLPSDNSALKYRIGMNGEASVVLTSKENVLTIPSDAVFSEKSVNYVYRSTGKNGQFDKTIVSLGLITDDKTEIISGLSEYDIVLVTLPKQ